MKHLLNSFLFFIFKNKKQFLKTVIKQALNVSPISSFFIHSHDEQSFLLDKSICQYKPHLMSNILMLNRINAIGVLQIQRPHTAISPFYPMCKASLEIVLHFFLHCWAATCL